MKNKYKFAISIVLLIVMVFVSYRFIRPYYVYTIENKEQALQEAISDMIDASVEINRKTEIDNKLIVLFTVGSECGESELIKGPNNKYKINFSGHGTNKVRYGITSTNKGQYVKFLGTNEDNISKIIAFMDGERYELSVPEGDDFNSIVPLKKSTNSSFPDGSVWFDKDNKEIIRIDIPNDYIL